MKFVREKLPSGNVWGLFAYPETEEESQIMESGIEFRLEVWVEGRGITWTSMEVPIQNVRKPHIPSEVK